MVKKAGEPCKLYCKGRIIGYKRCGLALPACARSYALSNESGAA